MNQEDKYINELFQKAKSDESIFSQDESRHLIESTNSLSNLNNSKLNLKIIGANNMTYLISSLVAVSIAGLTFFHNPDKNNATKTKIDPIEAQVAKIPNSGNKAIIETNAMDKISNTDIAYNPVSNKEAKNEEQSVQRLQSTNDNTIKGIEPIELTNEQLTNIGIDFSNGNVKFLALKDTKMPRIIKLLGLNRGVIIDEPTKEESNLNSLQPKFVTDFNGNKIISFMNTKDKIGILANFKNMNLDSNLHKIAKMRFNAQIDSMHKSFFKIDTNKISKLNSNLKKEIIINMSNMKIRTDSIHIDNEMQIQENLNNLKIKLKSTNMPNLDSILKSSNKNFKKVIIDKNKNQEQNGIEEIEINSTDDLKIEDTKLENEKSPKNLKFLRTEIRIDSTISSMESESESNLNHPKEKHDKNSSSIFMSQMEGNKTIDEINEQAEQMIKELESSDSNSPLDEQSLSKLIPIRIIVPNTSHNYLFWYEPNIQFTNNLPNSLKAKIENEMKQLNMTDKSICETKAAMPKVEEESHYLDTWRTCSNDFKEVKVFPNPAKEKFMLQFTLKQDAQVTATLNDISGKQLTTITTGKLNGNVEQTIPYSLKDFPSGMYYIVLKVQGGGEAIQRVIIE